MDHFRPNRYRRGSTGIAGLGRRRRSPTVPSAAMKFHGWWDYGGGEMMNWGAHHLDIAMWAMNLGHSLPGPSLRVRLNCRRSLADLKSRQILRPGWTSQPAKPSKSERPVPPLDSSGVLFEGEKGSLWVDRDNIEGPAAEELSSKPLPLGCHPPPSESGREDAADRPAPVALLRGRQGCVFSGLRRRIGAHHECRLAPGEHLDPSRPTDSVGPDRGADHRRPAGICPVVRSAQEWV